MGEKTVKIVKLSELIGRSTPFTGAFSLFSSPSSSLSRPTRNSGVGGEPDKGSHPDAAIPNQKVLKSLSAPALLTGTLTLPANNDDPASNCVCFQFSDGSATVCCDILAFDLKVIGKKIKILAWNFIPRGSDSGFLEIIRWDFQESSSFSDTFSLFSASITNSAYSEKARHFITGTVEAVSPVSAVLCAGSSTGESSGSKSLRGFLAEMLICECNLCRLTCSTTRLRNSNEHSSGHCFNKPVVVYFCGAASIWHPVMPRLVGRFVSLSGLKKKMVSIGKEICQLMYVTVEKSLMHISNLPDQFIRVEKSNIRGNGECGSYNGIVTAIYMQGLIVELDQQAMLLLTDRDIILPHSLRVGAVVSVKNVHFVNPRFSWSKFLILGSCIKTSVCVKSFSLLETGCYTKPQHQSLLRKFIDSLTFIARLWCYQKKGLAQLYATSHLPKSVFLSLHGPFWEFCKHDRCACGSEVNCSRYSLVVPFSNLINYCESIWIKELLDPERVDIMGPKDQYKSISCGSRDHAQLIWRAVQSEEIDIALVGHLKISSSSGRLQIVDATGSIDVAPDFSLNWNFESIYEVKRFTLSMQGLPEKMDHFNVLRTEPFACRSIFESGPQIRKINMSLHLAYSVADKESIDPPFSAHVKMKETIQDLERGQFHLLWIKHKFPIMQKYQGHRSISSKLSVFAEALVLPWDLHIPESNEDTPTVPFSDLLRDSMKYQSETLPPFKKRKIGHASMGNHYNFDYPSEVLCLVTGRRDNSHCIGKLQCHNAGVSFSCSEPEMRKILLEFTFDAFPVYEALRIGCYYIISHNKADVLCASANGSKVLLNSRIHIWSLSFSVAEISPEESYPQHETQSDVNLFLSPDFISLLEDELKLPKATLKNPIVAYEEETEIKNCNEASITSLAPPSGTRYSGHHLPKGNLISLCGWVYAVHHLDEKSQCVPLRGGVHGGALHSVLFEETCICVHLMVDQKMVKIYGAIHKSACPAVFGRGVTATFHRILVLSGQDSFMMIPSSFISVHSGSKVNDASDAIISHYVPAVDSRPSSDVRKALISETTHCSKSEPLLFRCRVVSVYVLIMENKGDYFFSHRIKPDSSSFHVNIPLAGFVIEDGSSSCCCWANSDRAAALLGLLHPKVHREAAHGKGRREQKRSSSVGCHLKEVIERHHGRVVVKNHGSTFDPSAQELTITGEDIITSTSDEEFLRMMILNACSSNSLKVAARVVDPQGTEELEKQLREVGMVLVPQMKNVWAFGVDHIEAVAEARNIIQGLLLLHQTQP